MYKERGMFMSRKFTLEEMKPMLGNDTIELPESIKVHWIGHHHDFDFEIKFVSKRGVGFPERMCGGQWCGLYYNSICVMPDGTKIRAEEFNNYDNWQEIFVNAILNWVKRPTLKIVDVIEFMDI